jgi:cytochrome c6
MFTRFVNAVELAALAVAAVFVVLLFTDRPGRARTPYATTPGAAPNGAAIFRANCATCHGDRGQGGIGPRLGGGQVVARFSNENDEIAIVTNGEGGMPAWRGTLSPAQIKAVVGYTRTGL